MSAKRIGIDASVALKWRLRDDEDTAQADQLLDDHINGTIDLLVPSPFDYEVTNALRSAVMRGRLSLEAATAAVADYQMLGLERHEFGEFQSLTLQLACRYQRSAYDSAYLALAQSTNLWFYTGDLRLFNAVGTALTWGQVAWRLRYKRNTRDPQCEGRIVNALWLIRKAF